MNQFIDNMNHAIHAIKEEGRIALSEELALILSKVQGRTLLASKADQQAFGRINNNMNSFVSDIDAMVSMELSVKTNDYYIYSGFSGSIAVKASYLGFTKAVVLQAKKVGHTLLINADILKEDDEVSLTTDGTIDFISVKKDKKSLFTKSGKNSNTVPYSVGSVYVNDKLIYRKVVVVPLEEMRLVVEKSRKKDLYRDWSSMSIKAATIRLLKQLGRLYPVGVELRDDVSESYEADATAVQSPVPTLIQAPTHIQEESIEEKGVKLGEKELEVITSWIEDVSEENSKKKRKYLSSILSINTDADALEEVSNELNELTYNKVLKLINKIVEVKGASNE